MSADLFEQFAASLRTVFETMLNLPVVVERARAIDGAAPEFEVRAEVVFSGAAMGRATMLMSGETGRKLAAIFAGAALSPGHRDFDDAIGELAHMVCGGAKGLFGVEGAWISCPSVDSGGAKLALRRRAPGAVWLIGRSECGDIEMEIEVALASEGGREAAA